MKNNQRRLKIVRKSNRIPKLLKSQKTNQRPTTMKIHSLKAQRGLKAEEEKQKLPTLKNL